jgi:hypothetical protein
MPSRLPRPPIDTAPIKDVARSLRFAVEQGGRSLRKGLPLEVLPEPAARLADAAFATARRIGDSAGRGAASLAHVLLDGDDTPPPLSHPEDAAAEARFAAAAHDGLHTALLRLGAESCLVSEAAAVAAWRRVTRAAEASDSETAAALYIALTDPAAVREVIWPEGTAPPSEAAKVATFAVLLAMLADPTEYQALLPAATDLALALAPDLAQAADGRALKTLFEDFRNHV